MKRLLSIILAVCMLVSVLPGVFAAQGDLVLTESARYEYVFTYQSHLGTDSSASGRSLINGKYTLDNTDSSVSSPWGFTNVKTAQGYSANGDWMVYQGRVSDGAVIRKIGTDAAKGNVFAAIGFEITVSKSGTYIPTLKYVPQSCSPIADIYLVKKTEDWYGENIGGVMGVDAFYNAALNSTANSRLGSVDLYGDFESAAAANMTSATMNRRYIEAGTYQLVFLMSGENANFSPKVVSNTDKRFYTNIYSLALNEDVSAKQKKLEYSMAWDALNTSGVWACGNDRTALGIRSSTLLVNGTLLTYDVKPVYNTSGNGSEENLISDHRMINLDKTAPWRLLAMGGVNNWNLEKSKNAIYFNAKSAGTSDNYNSRPAIAIGVTVPVPGKYMLSVNGASDVLTSTSHANPAILFEKYDAAATPREESSGQTFLTSFNSKGWGTAYVNGKKVIGRYNFASESGWKDIAEVTVGTAGEYALIMRYDPTATENTSGVIYDMAIAGIKLTPVIDTSASDKEAERDAIINEKGDPAESENLRDAVSVDIKYTDTAGNEIASAVSENKTVGDICSYAPAEVTGYTFKYWALASRAVTDSEELTFKAASNVCYKAVYIKDNDDTKSVVEFYNANGDIISGRIVNIGDTVEVPALPSLAGYGTATAWLRNGVGDDVTGSVIAQHRRMMFVAKYESETPSEEVSIAVTNADIDGAAAKYAEKVSFTAPLRSASDPTKEFNYWTRNGVIVSFDRTYSFYAYEDCTLEAVYKEFVPAATALRKIIISNAKSVGSDKGYVAEFIGFGSEVVERGILFGSGTPTVDSYTAKAVMKTDTTQFSAHYDAGFAARAYAIIFEGGASKVIYSDVK